MTIKNLKIGSPLSVTLENWTLPTFEK